MRELRRLFGVKEIKHHRRTQDQRVGRIFLWFWTSEMNSVRDAQAAWEPERRPPLKGYYTTTFLEHTWVP